MELLRPTRRALAGIVVGAASGAVAVAVGDLVQQSGSFAIVLVLAVAVTGLALGAGAALYAYAAAALTFFILAVLPADVGPLPESDSIRLVIFLLGSPFIVLMVYRAEHDRRSAEAARLASDEASRQALAERAALEVVHRDLDDALQRAERERARLEEVAEAIPEPLIVYDAELRGTYGNRAALRLFGRSFIERPIDDWGRMSEPRDVRGRVLAREEWPQVEAQLAPMRRGLTVRLPMSGRDLRIDVEGTPIPGGGCVLLLRDIGKEEDARRRLSRFASFVAHELRNPLAVAKARTELALRVAGVPQASAGHSVRALESVDAAIGILERLELYSRADAGALEAAREPFRLDLALAAAVERLQINGSERPLSVPTLGPTEVVGDRHLAEQAITNLLTNADRYSQPGQPVRVEVSDGRQVTLRVIDSGPGVSDEIAERLFHDRAASGRGLGLGLYLVQATMQAQGGSVQLEQRRPEAIFALRWQRAPRRRSTPQGDST